MSFYSSRPSSALAPYVKQYWALENILKRGESHQQRIVPTGLLELTFYFADRPRSLDPRRELLDTTIISGQQNSAYDLSVTGTLDMFSVTFQPEGAMMFFDLPLVELCDQTIPLRYLDQEWVDRVENGLFEAVGFMAKRQVIEVALGQLLKKNQKALEGNRIQNSIQMISSSRGLVSINTLASKACLSRKQYERVFIANVGISPKRFLRIVRFQHALYQKEHHPSQTFTELAYQCGYYDQSHLIHDFRALSGLSPGEYFAQCDAQSDYFQ